MRSNGKKLEVLKSWVRGWASWSFHQGEKHRTKRWIGDGVGTLSLWKPPSALTMKHSHHIPELDQNLAFLWESLWAVESSGLSWPHSCLLLNLLGLDFLCVWEGLWHGSWEDKNNGCYMLSAVCGLLVVDCCTLNSWKSFFALSSVSLNIGV